MESESVDLIYLDPPFDSNRAYNVIYPNDMGQARAFEDTWIWTPECDAIIKQNGPGMDMLRALVDGMGKTHKAAYLVMMTPRLAELHRLLKPTGSIYLHCDPKASHYLKVIMDTIFGLKNFLNEIAWCYKSGGASKRWFAKKHDSIFLYARSKGSHVFHPLKVKSYGQSGGGQGGKVKYYKDNKGTYSIVNARDWWEISMLSTTHSERLGYPTQKPLKLLDRIIRASSNPGDLMLDPFCGCGTSIHAAENLNRNWTGIDLTYSAIAAIQERFKKERMDIWQDINIQGRPTTAREINEKLLNGGSIYARKEFEKFCVATIRGLPNDRMGADGGIDGQIQLKQNKKAIVSVKSGNNVNVEMVRSLRGLLNEKQVAGVFITKREPTRDMKDFANRAGVCNLPADGIFSIDPFPRIQILTLEEILGGDLPKLPYAA